MKKLINMMVVFGFLFGSVGFCEPAGVYGVEQTENKIDIVVYRSPTCGCCGKWVKQIDKNKFNVRDVLTENVSEIKNKLGIKPELSSCHTAIVDGYVVEGHVPMEDVMNMLEKKPDIIGLTVPGMVVGTPGMEMGNRKDPFKVLSFDEHGVSEVVNSYD